MSYFQEKVRMLRVRTVALVVIPALTGISCGGNDRFIEGYLALQKMAFPDERGALLGKFGDVELHERDFYYASAAYTVSEPDELRELSEGARRLAMEKLLLRRMAVERGREQGIYSKPEAARYLAPRIEKLLEEYYYHEAGKFDDIARETGKLQPDDATLRQFMQENPVLKGKNLSEEDVRRETRRLLRRIARERESAARQKVIEELLKNNPPMQFGGEQ